MEVVDYHDDFLLYLETCIMEVTIKLYEGVDVGEVLLYAYDNKNHRRTHAL